MGVARRPWSEDVMQLISRHQSIGRIHTVLTNLKPEFTWFWQSFDQSFDAHHIQALVASGPEAQTSPQRRQWRWLK